MSRGTANRALGKKRRRWTRRLFISVLPTAVWVLAIAAAFHLYQRTGARCTISGFAEDQPVTLAHLEPGIVKRTYVQLYDRVTLGQVLVSMDDRQERIQLAVIEKDLQRLRLEVVAEQARVSADNARAIIDFEDLARRFAVDREAAHLDYLSELVADARDRILLRGADVEYDITRGLYETGNAPFHELNDIQTQVDSLRAALVENAEVIKRAKKALEAANSRWIEFVEREGMDVALEPVLAPLRLAIEVRQRDLDDLMLQIDIHVLRSPIDGQVTFLAAHPGDRVEAGAPLVVVSPTSTGMVVAYLSEPTVLSARVGDPVQVRCLATVDGLHREYAGTIARLADTITETPPRYREFPTYPVWGRGLVVALEEGVRLVPGEAVRIALEDRY
ncbi:MAG: HlyD family efflux transporter periplasmic adaptor subunit [Phycisphaerae bacterium]|nr:HlyD family efflux transporter periplasmic adaptor subunit [Phycisphaerae bacterium]